MTRTIGTIGGLNCAGVFDLNAWYQAQMPGCHQPDGDEICSYLSFRYRLLNFVCVFGSDRKFDALSYVTSLESNTEEKIVLFFLVQLQLWGGGGGGGGGN